MIEDVFDFLISMGMAGSMRCAADDDRLVWSLAQKNAILTL
jgi:hypothetical protein